MLRSIPKYLEELLSKVKNQIVTREGVLGRKNFQMLLLFLLRIFVRLHLFAYNLLRNEIPGFHKIHIGTYSPFACVLLLGVICIRSYYR